jgi:hypothetical protein
MTPLLPHVREPDGEPDVCAYCCEEWVDVDPTETCPLRELVALVNARLPEGSPYLLDPVRAVRFGQSWTSAHYWTLSDGCATASWEQGRPTPACPVVDPCIKWAYNRADALDRILAVERRRARAVTGGPPDTARPSTTREPVEGA